MVDCFSVRVGIHWLVTKPVFDAVIMFVIMLSSATLAAEDPVQEHSHRNQMLALFDYGFTSKNHLSISLRSINGFEHIPNA